LIRTSQAPRLRKLSPLCPGGNTRERDRGFDNVGEDRAPNREVFSRKDDDDDSNDPEDPRAACPQPERDCTVLPLPSGYVMTALLMDALAYRYGDPGYISASVMSVGHSSVVRRTSVPAARSARY
jgi:hypothetical protein